MKSKAIWAAAGLVLGMTTWVVGQGPDDDLVEQLHALQLAAGKALLAETAADPLAPPRASSMPMVMTEIADLVTPLAEHGPPRLDAPRDDELLFGNAEYEDVSLGTAEEVAELIRATVHPEIWEEGASMVPLGTKLVTVASPAVVQAMRTHLDGQLRHAVQRFATVDSRIVDIDAELAAKLITTVGMPLTEADLALLQKSRAWGEVTSGWVRTTGRIGQSLVVQHGRRATFVGGTDTKIVTKSAVARPIVHPLNDGHVLHVTVGGSAQNGYRVEADYQVARVFSTKAADVSGGVTMQNQTHRGGAKATCTWPASKWGLLGREDIGGEQRLFLIRVSPAGGANGPAKRALGKGEGR